MLAIAIVNCVHIFASPINNNMNYESVSTIKRLNKLATYQNYSIDKKINVKANLKVCGSPYPDRLYLKNQY